MLRTCSVLYTSLVSFKVLLFSNANWIVSSDHRSINMSVASLLQMRIVPLFFGFFEAIFLHAKSTRFWRPKAHFRPLSLSWQSPDRKDSGDKITSSFGTRAEKFAFTRQKSSVPCPILLARVPKFRSAVPKMSVV